MVVFGASWAEEGSALYEESVQLGKALAEENFEIVNGGYGGTMQGSAQGASLIPGSSRVGVVVPSLFPHRALGNPYLSSIIETNTLLDRIQAMVTRADYFVIMNGTLGTLTEAAIIWNMASLNHAIGLHVPMILAYRSPWEKVLLAIGSDLAIPPAHMARLSFVSDFKEAAARITADFSSKANEAGSVGGAGAIATPTAV